MEASRAFATSTLGERPYSYERLPALHIRLLKRKPGHPTVLNGTPRLEFEIVQFSLDNCPRYNALSYAWGDLVFDRTVYLQGNHTIKVTENLWNALNTFRHVAYLWADQVCINQEDDSERNHQVMIMKDIYNHAALCLAWIGVANEETEAAFTLVKQLASRSLNLPALGVAQIAPLAHNDIRRRLHKLHGVDLLPPVTDRRWNALLRLLDRQWYSRLWTFQEVVVSKVVWICCGTHMCLHDELQRAAVLTGRENPFTEPWPRGKNPTWMAERYRGIFQKQDETPLYILLSNTRHDYECRDPRDKIFALLGLQSIGKKLDVKPDYKRSAAEVYTSTTRTMINASSSLQVFRAICTDPSGSVGGLPSWVPDWSAHAASIDMDYVDENGFKFHASQHRPHQVMTSPGEIEAQQLVVAGSVIDTVEAILEFDLPGVSTDSGRTQFFRDLLPQALSFLGLTGRHRTSIARQGLERTRLKLIKTLTIDGYLREQNYRGAGWYPSDWEYNVVNETLEKLEQSSTSVSEMTARHGADAKRDHWLYQLSLQLHTCVGRRLVRLQNNQMGMCPKESLPGDEVCILHGANVPMVLRRQETAEASYRLVGPCYVDGVMSGEAVQWAIEAATRFLLV